MRKRTRLLPEKCCPFVWVWITRILTDYLSLPGQSHQVITPVWNTVCVGGLPSWMPLLNFPLKCKFVNTWEHCSSGKDTSRQQHINVFCSLTCMCFWLEQLVGFFVQVRVQNLGLASGKFGRCNCSSHGCWAPSYKVTNKCESKLF